MNIQIYKIEDTTVTIEEIVNLLHDAFEERKDQSLNYHCVNITVQEFEKFREHATVFVALDEAASGKLVGTASMVIKNGRVGKHSIKYAHILHAAVLTSEKGKGISKLLDATRVEYAKSLDCHYLMGDTAISATSSVKRLLKFGYKIVFMTHHKTTNYYSYVFKYWLQPRFIEENDFLLKVGYIKSVMKTKMLFKADGQYTGFAKIMGYNG